MKKEELKEKIDKIIAIGGDAEAAHSKEDALHLEIIENFCPEWVKEEIRRLTEAGFERWCA